MIVRRRSTGEAVVPRARILASAVFLAVAIVAAGRLLFDGRPPWEPERVRSWITQAGVLAPLLFVVVVALRHMLLLPSWVAHVSGGLLFGALAGTILGTMGTALGAVIAFGIGRCLGREAIVRRSSPTLDWAERFVRREGLRWLAAVTALPFTPLTPIYLAAGLTEMRLAPFVTATVCGLLPRVGLFSLLGALTVEPTRLQLIGASVLLLLGALSMLALRRPILRRDSSD